MMIVVWHQHCLDSLTILQAKEVLTRAVFRDLLCNSGQAGEVEVVDQQLTGGLGQVAHSVPVTDIFLVEPGEDLVCAERALIVLREPVAQASPCPVFKIVKGHCESNTDDWNGRESPKQRWVR